MKEIKKEFYFSLQILITNLIDAVEANDLQEALQDENENVTARDINLKNKKSNKSARSLRELYEKKCEEEEKARIEREAIIQAKKEDREKAESRRRALKEKMFKKTRSGQPVMKYRIEHLLETIQGANS